MPKRNSMKIASSPFANVILISLETELRKLRASQQAVRVDSGAAVTLMTQRMELLDRMFDLLEKKALFADRRDQAATVSGSSSDELEESAVTG